VSGFILKGGIMELIEDRESWCCRSVSLRRWAERGCVTVAALESFTCCFRSKSRRAKILEYGGLLRGTGNVRSMQSLNRQAKVVRMRRKVEDVLVWAVWIFVYSMVVVTAFPWPNVGVGE